MFKNFQNLPEISFNQLSMLHLDGGKCRKSVSPLTVSGENARGQGR